MQKVGAWGRPHCHAGARPVRSYHNHEGKIQKGLVSKDQMKAAGKVAHFTGADFRIFMQIKAAERREARMLGR